MNLRSILSPKLVIAAVFSLSMLSTYDGRALASRCYDLFGDPRFVSQQSAVEIEIGPDPRVIELFDTLDGTIRPAAGAGELRSIPEELISTLKEIAGPQGNPLDLPWSILSPTEKAMIISKAAEFRGKTFYQDRSVEGLRYKPEVFLTFTKKTRFLGKDYWPGKHKFNTVDIFGPSAIEFMGPNRMTEDLGFEIHVRSALPAGENLITARVLQKQLSGTEANVHTHLVGRNSILPQKSSRLSQFWNAILGIFKLQRPLTTATATTLRTADFVRKAMLLFDFKMIENGISMAPIENSGGGLNFFPVAPKDFKSFVLNLYRQSLGADQAVRSKSGTVGLRTRHFYDQNVWGIEVRYLSPRLDGATTARDLSILQNRMLTEKYFMTETEATNYLNSISLTQRQIENITDRLMYAADSNQKQSQLKLSEKQNQILTEAITGNDFVKMLLHDWSLDPMFFGRPERITQIKSAQQYCLRLILHGQSSIEVMQIFLKKSALAYEFKQAMDRAAQEL